MKPVYVLSIGIILIGIIISTLIFFSAALVHKNEPYNTTEIYEESYIVTEPREVRVADWIIENVTVNQSFDDRRYIQTDIKHDVSLLKCSHTLSYNKIDLTIPEWGKVNAISYGDGTYFAGYNKGMLSRKGINTFDVNSKEGHIYRIIKNEKVDITLRQGEYLPLALGYNIQVNSVDDNLKSYKGTSCGRGGGSHYYEEMDGDSGSDGGNSECISVVEYYQGTLLSLSDMNVVKTWSVKNGSTLIYESTLSGGETLPMIAVHIKEVTNSTVNIDAIFQLSKDYVAVPGGLGAEIAINIKNTDSQPGTFNVYIGFILNSSLGFEIGRMDQTFLFPSEYVTLYYTTDKEIEDCRYYSQSISKISVPENFTNFRDVNFTKRRTEYRNVTLYVDVIKTRFVERVKVNVTN